MTVLPNTKKVIIVNSGHWDKPETPHIEDSGARYADYIESIECVKIRDILVPMLERRGYTVHAVPDHLNLRESIVWANEKAPELNDALAIDIHLNYLSNNAASGCETFHGMSDTSKQIAAALADGVSKELDVRNRGAKPDTETAVGELGWIRKTTMWASLVEVCFISSKEDMDKLRATGGHQKAAKGIADGIDVIFGVETQPEPPQDAPACNMKGCTVSQLIKELIARLTGK